MDRLNLLALMVALSAYLAGIRFATIGRLASLRSSETATRQTMKTFLRLLVLADAPLVIAGLLVTVDLFPNPLFGKPAPAWCLEWAYRIFVFAVSVLALLHGYSWIRAFLPTGTSSARSLDEELSQIEREKKVYLAAAERDTKAVEALKAAAALAAEKKRSAGTPTNGA